MKFSPRARPFAAALLLALAQAAGAMDTRSKKAMARVEAELGADLRGAREQRQGEALAAHEESHESQVAAAHGKSQSRLVRWVQEAREIVGPYWSPVLVFVTEKARERTDPPIEVKAGSGLANEPVGKTGRVTFAVVSWLVSESVYLLLCLLVAYLYKTHKEWFMDQMFKDPTEKDFKKFTSPVIEPVLLWSCLCPGVRWADTMAMSNVISGYWTAFFIFFVMCVITGLSFGLPGWILMTCFMMFFRMRLRTKFDMEQNLLGDFCCFCWCMPCVIAQEARHVEEAKTSGNLP